MNKKVRPIYIPPTRDTSDIKTKRLKVGEQKKIPYVNRKEN